MQLQFPFDAHFADRFVFVAVAPINIEFSFTCLLLYREVEPQSTDTGAGADPAIVGKRIAANVSLLRVTAGTTRNSRRSWNTISNQSRYDHRRVGSFQMLRVGNSSRIWRLMTRSWTSSVSARSRGSGEKFVNAATKVCSIPMAGWQAPSCCILCNAPIPCHRKLASLYREIAETVV
jgi:hypothetical protein